MHFDDPGLAYGAALSKVVGRLVMRAADGPRVPAHYSRFRHAVVALRRRRSRSSPPTSARRTARSPTCAARAISSSPRRRTIRPSPRADKGITPLIDMLPLRERRRSPDPRRGRRRRDARPRGLACRPRPGRGSTPASRRSTSCCSIPQGLPGRPWYKNLIYAPGHADRLRRQDPARSPRRRSSSAASTTPAPMSAAPPR